MGHRARETHDVHGGMSRLRSSEWLLSGSLFLLLLSLYSIAKFKAVHFSDNSPQEALQKIAVQIEGHVAKPGSYDIPIGTSHEAALKKARPLKFADLRSHSLKEPISSSTILKIEKLQELAVQICGAVENPGLVHVQPGTRIIDLKKIVALTPNTDLSFFKKRRQLVDGETVIIPAIPTK